MWRCRININAENTFGFGEPVPGERLQQLVDLHLEALATAAAGGNKDFGVELDGRADLRRLALVGHSRGGEESLRLARQLQDEGGATANRRYGPVSGLLLLASTATAVEPTGGSPVPMAIVLPACDGDVTSQEGQHFYEAARLAPQQTQWATSAWLERANHNYFNQLLPDDPFRGVRAAGLRADPGARGAARFSGGLCGRFPDHYLEPRLGGCARGNGSPGPRRPRPRRRTSFTVCRHGWQPWLPQRTGSHCWCRRRQKNWRPTWWVAP